MAVRAGGADIWFSYTTTSTDAVIVSTCNNASYDTAIEIFSGDCANLVPVVCTTTGPAARASRARRSRLVSPSAPTSTSASADGTARWARARSSSLWPPPACSVPDAFEDNDDCASAVSLSDGSYPGLTLLESDNDYFAVTVADGATLDASIIFLNANGDMDLYLWDPLVACDTNVVGQGSGGGPLALGFSASDDETITYTNTTGASQDLVLEVDMFDAGGCSEYDLNVTGASAGGPGPVGTNYCSANPNSTGNAASISGFGETSVSSNDLTLSASDLRRTSSASSSCPRPRASSRTPAERRTATCVSAAPSARYVGPGEILSSGGAGEFSLAIDLGTIPQGGGTTATVAGDTWNFQAWYRDGVGLGSNFTDGIEINFTN